MRIVIAPDCFGGTLSAAEAAEAIAEGWRSSAQADELILRPLADGGPGFVEVMHGALGGELHELTVSGPLGEPVAASWLEHRGTGYIECAQACGLHLIDRPSPETARAASSHGVGELMAAALASGVRSVVVGLGGSANTDGGAGLLEALGDVRVPELIAATDVDSPLLGPHGAARMFGPQKGADQATVHELEDRLRGFAARLDPDQRDIPGAGAGGGIGFALLHLGGRRESGAALVRAAVRLDDALACAEATITGEGRFDEQSARGKLISTVAELSAERGIPCIVLAGQVVGDARMAGVSAAYSVAEHLGSVSAAMARPRQGLAALAARVAKDVSPWEGRNFPAGPLHGSGDE